MTLSHNDLLNLPVYTLDGTRLGSVASFEVDELEQRIKRYIVKTHFGLTGLFQKKLIINVQQVVSVSRAKLVVENTVLKQAADEASELAAKSTQPANH